MHGISQIAVSEALSASIAAAVAVLMPAMPVGHRYDTSATIAGSVSCCYRFEQLIGAQSLDACQDSLMLGSNTI